MIKEAIEALVSGRSLTAEEAEWAMTEIMEGQATPAQFGALVTALRMKGETEEEIAGLARVMRAKATRVPVAGPVLDTCGTGGDSCSTFNVSTAAAFVAAGAGLKVAKHGNRAMTGQCGSADVLEALGVKIDLSPDGVASCLERTGIGFMYAPLFHPAMRFASGPRRELGIRTIFNILGPLTNPAGALYQVIGVADPALGPKMAGALALLGSKHALIVSGQDGLDEVSISAPTTIWELKEGRVSTYKIAPEELGLTRWGLDSIKGGTPKANAATLRRVLQGGRGPKRQVVLLNAAAALVAADAAANFKEGYKLAQEALDKGRALRSLEALVSLSQTLK